MVVANELNYDYRPVKTPKYNYLNISPQTSVSTLTPTYQASGGQVIQFQIPASVINLSRSCFEFDLSIPATAAKFNWAHLDSFVFWQGIRHYSRGGTVFYDNPFLAQTLNILARRVNKIDDVLTWGKPTNDGTGVFNGLSCCNAESGTAVAGSVNKVVRPSRVGGVNGDVAEKVTTSYLEPRCFITNPTAVNTAGPNIKVRIYLDFMKSSIMAQDKDEFFGEITNIDVQWAAISNFLFAATDNADPATGSADYAGQFAVNNFQLKLAMETDELCKDEVMKKYNEGSLSLIVPHYTFAQQSYTNQVHQTLPMYLTRANGLFIEAIYFTAYCGANTRAFKWYRSNISPATGTPGVRIASYQTYLDEKPLQYSPYICSNGDDYLKQRESLRGSCILSENEHGFYWAHCDDFTNMKPLCDGPQVIDGVHEDNFFTGYPITKDITWRADLQMNLNNIPDPSGASYQTTNLFGFAIGLKHLKISSAGYEWTN